ncbi:GWT1-domain-containing protein [Syncephalis fuscata]|nr:GWT1-domain-containing protein [Syncephalis fuscata]
MEQLSEKVAAQYYDQLQYPVDHNIVLDTIEEMDKQKYRDEQINWVSGHTGSNYLDIINVIAVSVSFVWLWRCLQLTSQQRTLQFSWIQFAMEFSLIVIPSLISITYADYALLMNLTALMIGTTAYFYARSQLSEPVAKPVKTVTSGVQISRKSWLSIYRALLMLQTCAAILAVDFPVFPRRFAKVETFGVSLMDLGVGAVVFSSGVVAARPFLLDTAKAQASLWHRLKQSIHDSMVLLLIGSARLLAVKGTEYQEHVTEYGVHWNFFFTLGCLPVLVAIFHGLTRSPGLVAIAIATGYQFALTYWGGEEYILNAPRDNLVSMNREGLFSIAGYLSIFLFAMDVGQHVLPDAISPASARKRVVRLSLQSLGFWAVLAGITTGWGIQVSRRMTNLPYVLWIVAFSLSFMAVLHIMELILAPIEKVKLTKLATSAKIVEMKPNEYQRLLCRLQTPFILDAINNHSMKIFLLANLSTGLVNFSMRTLYASSITSMAVLSAYLLFICLAATSLAY